MITWEFRKVSNLIPTMSDLAPHKHEEPKHYKKNDGIRKITPNEAWRCLQ